MKCCKSFEAAEEQGFIFYLDKINKYALPNEIEYFDEPLKYCPWCGAKLE